MGAGKHFLAVIHMRILVSGFQSLKILVRSLLDRSVHFGKEAIQMGFGCSPGERGQKKKQHKTHVHQTKLKEIRLRPKTGEHDIEFKINQARNFLSHKDKVAVSVIFRGREMAHIDEGQRIMRQVIEQLEDISKVESSPQQTGRRLICTLAPR